jgi:iron complex transport system permease protein
LPTSAVVGAIYLVICDDIARVITTPFLSLSTGDFPVGIITMLFGGPFFIFLLKKKKGGYTS